MAPGFQPWITRIGPNFGQLRWLLERWLTTRGLEQPWGRFFAGQGRDFGAAAVGRRVYSQGSWAALEARTVSACGP